MGFLTIRYYVRIRSFIIVIKCVSDFVEVTYFAVLTSPVRLNKRSIIICFPRLFFHF